jgi:CDP-diacylglycerol---serine O-phosphatidyltransferase
MRKIYLIPNIITAFGLACGLFVIFKVNMVEPGSGRYEVILSSALLLLLAAIADFIDGAFARAFRVETEFGFMFDSLADSITFGVAPSVLALKSLSLEQGTLISFISATGAMVYSICGVLRLVRFNVKNAELKKDIMRINSESKHFSGLPITAAAIATVSINLFTLSPFFNLFFKIEQDMRAVLLTIANVFIGYLMLCRWKFPSLKALNFRVPSFNLAFITVVLGISFLYGILHYFSTVILVVSWVYVLTGVILAIIRKVAGKKSKTLKEFEPDSDDIDL